MIYKNQLTGFEAFSKFLEITFHNGGEVWPKVSHNIFFKGSVGKGTGGLTELYSTKGADKDRTTDKKIEHPYEYLRGLSETKDGGVFFIPAKPQGAPIKDCVKVCDLLSIEMDGGSTEEQWERLNQFSEVSGLIWSVIVGSGSKSLHGHIVLESLILVEERTHLQRLLAIWMLGDPAVCNPHQPMRLPGFFRKEKNREQPLVSYCDKRYSPDEIWGGLKNAFEAEGYQFYQDFSDERWGKLRRVIANQKLKGYTPLTPEEQKAEIKRILALSEEEINPPKTPRLKFNLSETGGIDGGIDWDSIKGFNPKVTPKAIDFTYGGDIIPLEYFLSKIWQDYIVSGIPAAGEGRNPVALKMAGVLLNHEEILQGLGIKYSGNTYDLVSQFCANCTPPLTQSQADSIYRSALTKPSRRATVDESDVKAKIFCWQNPNKSKLITQQEWSEKFGLSKQETELAQIIERFFSRFKNKNKNKPIKETTPTPTPTTATTPINCSAIVKWEPQPLISITYTPGQLPTFDEWQQMGCPKIIFNNGERLALYGEAAERGFKITLDTTAAGHGKSFDSGLATLETFGIDPDDKENKARIFYLSPDHRNPTNATVEANYVDLEARHNGLNYDTDRTTALGKSHVIRAKNQNPDIPSNCPENQTFLTVAEMGLSAFGGKDSPICQSCPLLNQGCLFLENRRYTLTNERLIRADINSIHPSSEDILILDDLSLVNTHQTVISIDELLKTVGKLQLRDDARIFKVLRLILVAVYKALKSITTEKHKYGISHREVMKLMPTVDELNQLIFDLYSDDWLACDNVWGTPIYHYEMINGIPEATKVIGENFIAPSLIDLRNECYKIFENYSKFINGLQTPEEKQQAIKDNIIPSWLPALFDCLTGNKRVNSRIDNSKLTITKLSKRHRNIIKGAGFSIALDATKSKQDYALSLGISSDEILEVSEVKQDTPNLTIHIIKGMGRGGKQRRDGKQDKYTIAVNAIAQRHQGRNIGVIDHKSAVANYQDLGHKLGYWHKDTRGSNQFLNTQVMVSVGHPCPNLGQVAAEYQALTGYSFTPDQRTGRYGDWVKRKIEAELIQYGGRLRAHLRPTEELHCYFVADLDDDTLSALRLAYPTATVITEDVYDIAPEAASKGVQTERGIIEALWSSVKSGAVATIDTIADGLGITKSGVSHTLTHRLGIGFKVVKKSLVLLLEAINNKTQLSELDSDSLYIANEYLPNVIADFEHGDTTAADVVVEIITTAKAFGEKQFRHILAETPIPTVCKLLGAVLRFTPQKILSELIPIPIPISVPHLKPLES